MAVSENEKLPLRWSTTENVEWGAEVPGMGWSSPIEAGDTVLVTTATSSTVMKPPQIGTDFSNEYLAELTKQGLSEEEVLRKLNERDMEFPSEIELEYLLIAYELETGSELWRRSLFKGRPPGGRHRKNSFTSETPVTRLLTGSACSVPESRARQALSPHRLGPTGGRSLPSTRTAAPSYSRQVESSSSCMRVLWTKWCWLRRPSLVSVS